MQKTAEQQQAKRTDIYKVPFPQLRIKEGFNIRTDMGDINELAGSILANGVKNSLRGYRSKEDGEEVFIVTDGHRRYAALKQLFESGNTDILAPFVLEERSYNDEQRIFDMFICNEGKQLNPLEQALGIQRLVNYGYDLKEISSKLGKTLNYVQKLNALNELPKKAIKMIEDGKISATYMMTIQSEGKVEELLNNNLHVETHSPAQKPKKITKRTQKIAYEYDDLDVNANPIHFLSKLDKNVVQAIADGTLNLRKFAKQYLKPKED